MKQRRSRLIVASAILSVVTVTIGAQQVAVKRTVLQQGDLSVADAQVTEFLYLAEVTEV